MKEIDLLKELIKLPFKKRMFIIEKVIHLTAFTDLDPITLKCSFLLENPYLCGARTNL